MWIFCCGMIRSGSTVQYEITQDIIETQAGGKGLGFVRPQQFIDLSSRHDAREQHFVIKCHAFIADALPLFVTGQARAIYVYRDLRDVVVSMMRKQRRDFDSRWVRGLLRNCLTASREWQNVGHILVSRYEDMVGDLRGEAHRIAEHLGMQISDQYARELADKYALEQQKRRIQGFDFRSVGIRTESGSWMDPKTLLHDDHIHSGASGHWKTKLLPLQVAFIEACAQDWMVRHGYSLSQSALMRRYSQLVFIAQAILRRGRGKVSLLTRLARGRRVK
jgi:hypothetical protein